MKVATDIGHQITARGLMHIMLYDNGAVIYNEPDNLSRYPKVIFDKITNACDVFFSAHPELLTDENLELMAAGEEHECELTFGIYPEYELLSNLLNEYFEIM